MTDGAGEDTFHVKFDPDDDSIIETIVTAVSAIHNKPFDGMDPLAHHIDPTLLEHLVTDSHPEMISGEVTFQYEGLNITVDGEGDIYLEWI